ncbi:MAG TPA: RNB domain-containing ribonuclease, partial [Kofleriaceae bacterium]
MRTDPRDVNMVEVARRVLREHGFEVEPPHGRLPEHDPIAGAVDLRDLPWSSIDNVESRDLDQVEHATQEGDSIRLQIGIADVDALVPAGSPIDDYAAANTTSLYTGAAVFPMLPEELSTDR